MLVKTEKFNSADFGPKMTHLAYFWQNNNFSQKKTSSGAPL